MKYGKLALLFLVTCFCFSCTPSLYVPPPLNMPLAGNKDEFKGNLFAYSNEFGIQASYAVDSHCVLLTSLTGANGRTGTATLDVTTYYSTINNFLGDIGAGYFEKFDQNGRFEVLGGFGYGNANSHNVVLDPSANSLFGFAMDNISGNFMHGFGQCDIGLVKKNFEFGLGLRLSYLTPEANFQCVPIGNTYSPPEYSDEIGGSALFLEPAIMISAGLEQVKLNLSIGYSSKLFGADISRDYGSIYQDLTIGFGISCNLNREF